MNNPEVVCLRCGRCCQQPFSRNTGPEDLARWERERRYDLIAAAEEEERAQDGSPGARRSRPCRFNKTTEDQRTYCVIYEARPVVCRGFTPGRSRLCPAGDAAGRSREKT